MIWVQIGIAVVMLIISYVMQPKIPPQRGGPGALDDIDAPTATEDRVITQIFGRRWNKSPNVVWYGNIKTKPIRK